MPSHQEQAEVKTTPKWVMKMQHTYEIHYLLGKTKRSVTIPAPSMDSSLALKIAITHAGACAGISLPLSGLSEILWLIKQWKVANVRWNKAVSFTRRDVTLQYQQLVCPRSLEDTARQACTRIACLSSPEVCASIHQRESAITTQSSASMSVCEASQPGCISPVAVFISMCGLMVNDPVMPAL